MMMFSDSNKYFLQNSRQELSKLNKDEALSTFNEKFKEQAFERIQRSYSEITHAERFSFYEDVLEHLGDYVVDELIIDIYLEDECDQILKRVIKRLSILESRLPQSFVLSGLLNASSCNCFLKEELTKCIGITEVDLHNTNQNSHPIIKKFAISINSSLLNSKGEAELRRLLIHFIKFWSLPNSKRGNRNDKGILLLHLINTFIESQQNNLCLNLKEVVADLNKYRLKDLVAVPLLNLDKGKSDNLPVGYFILKERLQEKLEHISFLKQAITPNDTLEFLKEYIVKHNKTNNSAHFKALKAKVISEVHKVKKEDILKIIGIEALINKYQADEFLSKIIRRKYIIEVIE
ncbi:hypothetical protein ABID22_000336 [Pontibacter aydingkolensis]|uniref:Uncharacterized protein n=1 Tax=Pontibacter aydingkolensis TaxID=1911536 RepID=A0ABS7CQ74_9BACT|nr:hypothetical protein [Pontibacter aydingkolensis]MBW7465999.1 hypothetical protein [Pontibacter aydingkolensis]